ncbi:phosphatidylinositol-4-phosphate 5-kinase family protein, putative [Babesia bigemina]|uniref:Phosphatidylinositol-4-phosphate 5-kinase family protein, putative n=1 Tax=Babesia bigemina TaxID=5866 RepID=A0A061D7U0_BABBI|nr:phosphatidylinositol-4-phosphate 5-kinase family protein, putative [Babesia bigemina]CDR93780.1 phosphatidylinositol-4-phosphate 5-kinase family protein, putative [Babesia bigemina]|eukprot:XP_012765966.1 phosphatidylinositol-4-phosphate 5-kinase family protein, putative [Babesia bigemina]
MQGSLRYSCYVSAFEDGLCMQLKCSRRRNHPSCQKKATRPQATAYATRRRNRVLKHGSKRSRDSDPRRIDHEEHESGPSEPDTSWHGAVFGDGCTYWHTELLQLVEKYIKRNLRHDNGGLHLGRAYLDHLSSLLLRCVFRAKLQHVHRDIDEVVKVLQVPPTLHTALNIEGRHGFAVFPGICFRGHLAHPRMCRNLEGCDVLLLKSLLSRTVTDLSLEYNDIRDFGGVLGCVDVQVERLCSAGVKLVLCSGSMSAEISQKFHMRGISCVSNVDFDVLSQLALALARPLVDSLDKCFEISKHVGRIDSFQFVQKSGESVAAISVNANFHGCTILYSTSRLTWANSIRLKELFSTALFRLQGVFEELMFVKDLGGSLDVGNATCFHLESARGILSRRSSISMGAEPTLQRRNSLSYVRSPCSVISAGDSNPTPRSTLTGSVVYSRRNPKCRSKRFRDIVRGSQRIDIFKWDSHRRINGHQVHLHFSDWLSQHLLGVLVLPTAVEDQGDPGGNLKEQSILHCFEYFTKFSEICGSVTRRTVPVGRYTAGSFVSDFVLAYARHLRRDNCLSSESCSEQLSRHVMHLETSNAVAPVQHKRLRVLVDNRDTGLRPAESGCTFFIHTHCRSCGKADILPVNDLTFGRFVHLLLYNRCYTSRCGHNLFGGHDFSLRAERFTLYMQVEDITNYQIGAWFDSQLLNCGMGFMPLSSAGMSLHNRRLLQVSSKLLKVFEDYSDVDLDTNFESSDAVCRDTPRGPASPRPPTPDFNWEPYDEQEMDMLYLKDRSSMLGLALRNLFKMLKACLRSRFVACASTVRLEDVLPCRCELGGNSSSRKLDNRNQWSSEFVMKSMQHLMQLFEERNAFGLYLHPLLLDGVGAAFGGAGSFGFCGRCQKAKFSSIADIEILNWIYIFTGVVRCLGVKLHNLSSALRQSLTPQKSSDINSSSQAVALSTTEHERASSVYNRVIGKTVDAIDDCLEGIRSIYEQCVSHLLFAQLWCPLDPLHLLMTVRSFFVALTSLCRSTVRVISRVPGWALLKTMRFIDTGTIVVALKTTDCVGSVESGSSHGSNGALRTQSAGNDESETRKGVGVNGQSGGEANGGPSTTGTDDHNEVHHEVCDSDPSRPHIVRHGEGATQSYASARLTHGGDPPDPHRHIKDGFYTVWGAQIRPQRLVQSSGNQQMRDADEPSVNALSGSGVATSCTDANRNYTLPHFIHYALNTSITAGFVGQSDEWFGSPSSLWHMLSRMRIGCPKRMSSVVSLSYGIVHNLRRDVCNVISAAIMSPEYLEQCSSHFQGPVSANLCSMGKCLLNYCKNQNYSIMANISCGPHRDDIFGVSVEGSHSAVSAQANRRHGGLLMDSLVLRYLKRHSHLISFLVNSADCAVRLREIEMDGALVVRRWDDLHSSLPSSPWCSMAGSASELSCANLLCFWKSLRVIGDDPLLCVSKDSASVFCPITRPCYGTPIVCCSNRLSRYQWSKHEKVFGQVPVMDHAIKLLRGNMASKRDVLRTVVDWTCRQLESACYQRSRTHAMVAYVESQVGFICNREFCRVQVTGDAELPLAAFTVEPFAPGGYTPCSPFFQESPCIGLSPGRQYFTLSSFSSRDGDYVGLIRGTSAVEPVVPMPAAKVGGAFERHRVPAGKDLSRCTFITLTSAHTNCDVTLHYPEAFHSLRHLSCGDDTSFARSLCRSSRLRCSGGKSGAPLFVSHDGKFILKLLNKYEFQLFVDSGARFFEHVLGGGTLLSIPLGLFSIRYRSSGNTVRCLVMQNVDHVLLSHKLTFDLKGISFKRCVNLSPNKHSSTAFTASGRPTLLYDNTSEESADVPNQVVLLDQNFKDFTNGCPIRLEESSLLRILDFVQRDLTFLSQLDVVDYSLLLRLYPAEGVVVLGIIDYLRPYTWDKQIETIGKKLANIAIGQEPTIVSPVEYRSRFMRFFSRIFWLSPEVEERAPTPVRVPKPVRRAPPVCRCTVCAALASLYTTPYVTSLSHYMLGTSPLAKRYLRSLIASSTPCMSTAEAAYELAKLLRTIYDDAVLDVRYSSV